MFIIYMLNNTNGRHYHTDSSALCFQLLSVVGILWHYENNNKKEQ